MHGATCVACNRPVMSMPQHCVRLVVSLNSGLIQLLPRCRAGGRVRVCVRQQTRLVSATPIACRSRVCTRTTDGHRSGVLAISCAVCRQWQPSRASLWERAQEGGGQVDRWPVSRRPRWRWRWRRRRRDAETWREMRLARARGWSVPPRHIHVSPPPEED